MRIESIHIGKIILDEVKEQKLTASKFAQSIGIKRQNVKKMVFEKDSLDTNFLIRISKVLNRNFFECYVFGANTNILQKKPEIKAKLTVFFNGEEKEETIDFNF